MNDQTRVCCKCETELSVDRFNKRANGRCVAYCKACQSLYARGHYLANKSSYYAKRRKSNRRAIERNQAFAATYLVNHPCVDCGQSDPIALDFDHVDPLRKNADVSDLIRNAYGLTRIVAEIKLCVVRCVNCHRARTAKQFGWRAHLS